MRKTMEVAALFLLCALFGITYAGLHGSDPVPSRIPTHFDLSGRPNAWGPSDFLWLLPMIGTGLYLLMTVLAGIRFRRYNLPVRVTETNLPFIQSKTGEMVSWIKCELLALFAYLQWSIIKGARAGEFLLSPAIIPISMVAVLGTVAWYLTMIIRGAKVRTDSEDSANQSQN